MKNSFLVIWIVIIMILFCVIYFIGLQKKDTLSLNEAELLGNDIVEQIMDIKIESEFDGLFTSEIKTNLLKDNYIFYLNEKLNINLISKKNLESYEVNVEKIENRKIQYIILLKYKEKDSENTYIENISFGIIKDKGDWKINLYNKN